MDRRERAAQWTLGLPICRTSGRAGGSLASQVAPALRRTSSLRPRDLVPLDRTSGAARFFDRMVREIEVDLGAGRRRNLSRIETELIRAFAGAATQLQYLNHQILLGEGSEIDCAAADCRPAGIALALGETSLLARPPSEAEAEYKAALQQPRNMRAANQILPRARAGGRRRGVLRAAVVASPQDAGPLHTRSA